MRERWMPVEGRMIYDLGRLEVGAVVAIDYSGFRHKAWRVYEIRRRDDEWFDAIVRPDGAEFDFAQHNRAIGIRRHAPIFRLPEHYGLCHACGELTPCSEVWTATVSDAAAAQSARFEVEGICPSCQEPVTARQKSHRFEENLRVPLGPPVTFHARSKCAGGAVRYDEQVAKSTGREPRLSCAGLSTTHLDGHRQCTNVTCPDFNVRHRSWAMCYALSTKCNRPECWAIDETRGTPRR